MNPKPGKNVRVRVKDYIMRSLGAPTIKVELTESQLDECFDFALLLYSQYCSTSEEYVPLNVQADVNGYDVPEDYLAIREVIYNPHYSDFFLNDFFDGYITSGYFYNDWGRIATLTDYVIQTTYNDQYIRTIGKEGTWEMVGNKLYLYPTPTRNMIVLAKVQFLADDIDIRFIEWIKEYSLAHAKEILGRVRSKYQGLPGPRGDLSLDGDKLLSESETMKEKLKESLLQMSEPIGFLVG